MALDWAVWSKNPLRSTGTGSTPGDGRVLEQVELDLGVGVEGEAPLGRGREVALEHVARVGVRRGAVGHHDVAEHPRGRRAVAAPRQDLERRRVGLGEHVGLVDPGESLDRRAVEADALLEGALELGRRHRHRLEVAQHVGEPQPHEADVTLLERPQHEVFLLAHVPIMSQACFRRVTQRGRTRPARPPVADTSLPKAPESDADWCLWRRTTSLGGGGRSQGRVILREQARSGLPTGCARNRNAVGSWRCRDGAGRPRRPRRVRRCGPG